MTEPNVHAQRATGAVKLKCPGCGEQVSVARHVLERGTLESMQCPACGKVTRLPPSILLPPVELLRLPSTVPVISPPASPTMKRCPYCAESVMFDAVKCKHCGSMIGSEQPEPRPARRKQQTARAKMKLSGGMQILAACVWVCLAVMSPDRPEPDATILLLLVALCVSGVASFYRRRPAEVTMALVAGNWLLFGLWCFLALSAVVVRGFSEETRVIGAGICLAMAVPSWIIAFNAKTASCTVLLVGCLLAAGCS